MLFALANTGIEVVVSPPNEEILTIGQIKVSTPLSSSMILHSFPPSQATFNRSLNPVLVPMLGFLQTTGSYLMLNSYPYYDYIKSNGVLLWTMHSSNPSLQTKKSSIVTPFSTTPIIDAAYFSMAFLNYTNIPVVVSEKGWP